ncbi:MAG: penicillin-binding protein [Bacteroidales bacterium]|jgi:cell division protein FtsI (penicillin-binding protein 3)|nr:penicillin-binding protein [Bacteroidales bacterium]
MDIKQDIVLRVSIIYILVFIFGIGVAAKIVHIQFFDENIEKYTKNNEKTAIQKPLRGDIFSQDDKLLACSVPEYVVYFDYRIPAFAKSDTLFKNHVEELATGLAKIFADEGKSRHQYLKELHSIAQKKSFLRLHRKPIDYTTLQKVKKLPILKYGPYKGGIIIDTYNSRVYPYGNLARRTIGLIRKGTFHGTTGLELYYDEKLSGGEKPVDVSKQSFSGEVLKGYDIITTIHSEIQSLTTEELHNALIKHKAKWGCAIVMEVETGEVLAISNLTRSVNQSDTTYMELINYAVDYRSDPGSTMKLPTLLAALEDGLVDLDDSIQTGNGKTRFYGLDVIDWNFYTGGFGKLSVKDVFAQSSNVGMAKIIHAHYLHPNKEWDFVARLQTMGLNKISGIDLSKERKPLVKDPSMTTDNDKLKWYKTTPISMAYGYEIELTPMQMLTFYNAIANDGVMVQPHLLKYIKNGPHIVHTNETKITNNNVVSSSTLKKAHILLKEVVTTGTAKSIQNDYYSIAGKTGTAQTIVGNRYNDKILRGSFCGYFPADKPKYSCIIVMQSELPYKPYKVSGTTAAKVFRKISDRIYFSDHELRNQLVADTGNVLKIPHISKGYTPNLVKAFSLLNLPTSKPPLSNWLNPYINHDSIVSRALIFDKETVPNLRGMSGKDAVYLVENIGLRANIKGFGHVYAQSIPAGKRIKQGETIVLELK